MVGASDMKLINYKVLKTIFELNESFEHKKGKIVVQPDFKRDIKKINDTQYEILLSVKISPEINKGPLPFSAEVVISSLFEMNEWEKEDLNNLAINNATAILFPYLRTLLATVTMNGGIPPFVLPIMNVAKLFMNKN